MRSLKRTPVLKVDPGSPDKKKILQGASLIKSGSLVAFPTETVYGIAANLLDKKAVNKLYRIKNRPKSKPFTVHISDLSGMKKLGCVLSKEARVLVKRFWPGPLTIVLKAKKGDSIGFRMPANKVAIKLIEMAHVPVIAPSANLSGNPAPKTAGEVLKDLDGRLDLIIDAGPTRVGVESTVVDMTKDMPVVLREGAIKSKEIYRTLKIK